MARQPSPLAGRRGTSLVEMLLVLVLGGVITTAAVSMIAPTNRIAAEAVETGEMEEGVSSTLNLIASTLRRVPLGGVQVATRDSVVIALPLAIGAFCATDGSRLTMYLGLGGQPLNVAAVDGFAFRSGGVWSFTVYAGTTMFSGVTQGRAPCVATGGGVAGSDSDYYTFYVNTSVPVGTPFLIWDRRTLRFGASSLEPALRGFHYGATGAPLLEVAFGLNAATRFEYRLRGSTTWYPSLGSGYVQYIDAVRVIAGSVNESSGALLAREIPLVNSE